MMEEDDPPLVHSVSYGWQGNLSDVGCEASFVKDIDDDFAGLAARGITLIFSSGDAGSGWAVPDCLDNELKKPNTVVEGTLSRQISAMSPIHCCGLANAANIEAWTYDDGHCSLYSSITGSSVKHGATSGGDMLVPRQPKLWPNWPASSPYVTAVGATKFISGGSQEMAVTSFGSGGGFSWTDQQAYWQTDAVANYLEQGDLPPDGSYPRAGRATPDVAVLGEQYQVITSSEVHSADGTSASAPAFAAMVSLVNERRLEQGYPAMGFLNPFLYQNRAVFTDITVGDNAIGGWGEKLKYGWDCKPGWDPVTGLGTPNWGAMLKAALGICQDRDVERMV